MPVDLALELPPENHPEELSAGQLLFAAARKVGCLPSDLGKAEIRRISFDARPRHLNWRVALTVWYRTETIPGDSNLRPPTIFPPSPTAPRVVVIGCGPAGMFCALDLLQNGLAVTLLERGKDVQARRRDIARLNRGEPVSPESNYCFGEGGAGTYSDGKLYTRSGSQEEVELLLTSLVQHGAPKSILYSWRPHVGSNLLPKVVRALRETLLKGGCDLRFETKAVGFQTKHGRLHAVETDNGEILPAKAAVLATGHSALNSLLMAREAGAQIQAKGFSMGVRVEHPQSWLDQRQYRGAKEGTHLPPAFYELKSTARARGVYSFCMCPGGWVVPSHTSPTTLVVNGMSLSKRDSPFANSGVVVEIQPKDWCGSKGARWGWPQLLRQAAKLSDHPLLHETIADAPGKAPIEVNQGRLPIHPDVDPLFGLRIQLALEVVAHAHGGSGNRAPVQRIDHFVAGRGKTTDVMETSYLPGLQPADFNEILPKGIRERLQAGMLDFNRRIPGFVSPKGQMIGVETRTSSPVRILRAADTLESSGMGGLYPCGEGAGFAGGIVSAALDGRRVASAVSEALSPRSASG